jgi:hypothetical protein
MEGYATGHQVLDVQFSVRFEEVEEGKDQWHQSLPHSTMLRFKFTSLCFGGSQKDLLGRLSRNHGG